MCDPWGPEHSYLLGTHRQTHVDHTYFQMYISAWRGDPGSELHKTQISGFLLATVWAEICGKINLRRHFIHSLIFVVLEMKPGAGVVHSSTPCKEIVIRSSLTCSEAIVFCVHPGGCEWEAHSAVCPQDRSREDRHAGHLWQSEYPFHRFQLQLGRCPLHIPEGLLGQCGQIVGVFFTLHLPFR